MRTRLALPALLLIAACSGGGSGSPHLYVWAGAMAEGESDFLAVINADRDAPGYGEIVATAPVGERGGAHHSEHQMPAGDTLFVNAFGTGRTFLMDVSNPVAPRVAGSFDTLGGYAHPHSYARLPNGNVLMTYQMLADNHDRPGGLVEVTPSGAFVRASRSAANPVDSAVRPYSVTPLPEIDRVVTTTTDMHGVLAGSSFQVWRLSDLALLHTVTLPTGPRGNEEFDPAEVRVLEDGTVILTTFRCAMYRLTDLESELPRAELIYTWNWTAFEDDVCALGVARGRWWVQAVANRAGSALVTLDMRDPGAPREVSRVVTGRRTRPHWLALDPAADRVVLTSGEGRTQFRVMLFTLERGTGRLALDSTFHAPGDSVPGVSFDRTTWPHGAAGRAAPHGAVFGGRIRR